MGNFSIISDPEHLHGPDNWAYRFMQLMNQRLHERGITESYAQCARSLDGTIVAATSITGLLPILVACIPARSTAYRGYAGHFLIRVNDAGCEHRRLVVASWIIAVDVIIGHAYLSGAIRKVTHPAFPDECDASLN